MSALPDPLRPEDLASTPVEATPQARIGARSRPIKSDERVCEGLIAILKAYERRLESGHLDALTHLMAVKREVDRVVDAGVKLCRNDERYPASWTEVGEATGLSAQGAQQRWAEVGGKRKAGGQPSLLR
jgi:hypothetical protein